MKMTSMVLLGAAILYLPQVAVSAGGMQTRADGSRFTYRPLPAAYPQPPANHRPDYRAYPQWRYGRPDRAAYRFRPWDGDERAQAAFRPAAPAAAPAAASVSYWGGLPVNHARFVRPPAYPQNRMSGPRGAAYPGWMPPASVASAERYRAAGYRFRPLPGATPPGQEGRLVYRPLQVKIPEHYIFRPLNPLRHTSVPAAVAQRQLQAPEAYPAMPYPDARFRSFNPYPAQPWPMNRYAYRGYPAPWDGYAAAPRPWPAPAWAMPRVTPMPPYYARGMGSPERFPPRPAPFPRERARNDGYYRFAQRGMMPPPRYTYGSPDWRYQPYRQRSRMPYPDAGRMAFRPPRTPARLNPYGVDWYDGRGDGDGAWYKLPQESWPAVSQRWEDDAGSSLPWDETY
ncbi:MAG: hypothetical protein P8178_04690 [Candidatus Thiodiazotropha sp.]